MHMADALLSPAVGGTMWAASAATIAYCSKKVCTEMDDSRIPLMGVLSAFIFAAQMINFTIPVTGSSGHLGGGLMLSILLGPHAAFLTIASVLVVQAFFFADGGLLALGCNMFNLGFFPAFIAYPLIYKKIVGSTHSRAGISIASIAAAVIGLQLGSFGVVVETVLSEISSLPFSAFAAIMQPIHLAIGIVEGMVTASVISFVYTAKPEIMQREFESRQSGSYRARTIVLGFLAASVLTGGVVSWFASEEPDGLEWSITAVTGQKTLNAPEHGIHNYLSLLQKRLSFLPEYSFRQPAETKPGGAPTPEAATRTRSLKEHTREESRLSTSVSGIVGGVLALGLSLLIGFVLKSRSRTPLNAAKTDG